jgi:hypothetical protein
MDQAEFLRKQAERFLALAQECADPNVKAKLVEMANEYIELMNAASLAGPRRQGKQAVKVKPIVVL